jgi:hypothetical protein
VAAALGADVRRDTAVNKRRRAKDLQRPRRVDDLHATALRAEVESRLRPVCPDWPETLFQAVVSQIVEITIKYDHGGKGDLVYDERIAKEMVADLKALADRSAKIRAESPSQPTSPLDS